MEINPHALTAIRERSGMSITSLATKAGTKQAHLSNIEAGRRNASPELTIALALALKCELPAILKVPMSLAVAS